MIPNWLYNKQAGEDWGDAVILKENAPEALAAELASSRSRSAMRIFMSSVTDPYQPLERRYRLTRRCLEVFAQYDDLDLLVIQTRSPLVLDDLAWIKVVPYAWLSMTIETDRGDLPYGPNRATIEKRLDAVQQAAAAGIPTQITVSPCLPYTSRFADRLASSGAARVVVDTFVEGDGSQGSRTGSSPFAAIADYDWRSGDPARRLYEDLQSRSMDVDWSAAGFGGIPPRAAREGETPC
jgi:DNA repair photolyase